MRKILAAVALAICFAAPVLAQTASPPSAVEMPVGKPMPATANSSAPIVAQTSPVVVIPTGDWITQALDYFKQALLILITAAFAFLCRNIPAALARILQGAVTDKLLSNALDYAIAGVEGAVKGDVLSLPVANAVVKTAADYVVANAPSFAKWLGATLKPKLIARLSARGALPAMTNEAILNTTPVGILKQNV